MLNEESVKREVQSIKDRTLNEAIKLLSSYEGDLREYLADIIAALCGVSAETVRNGTSKDVYNAQVRWLYWYAYRYMTNESFFAIAEKEDHRFGVSTIMQGVWKIGGLIDAKTIWTRRWTEVKKIIQVINKATEEV